MSPAGPSIRHDARSSSKRKRSPHPTRPTVSTSQAANDAPSASWTSTSKRLSAPGNGIVTQGRNVRWERSASRTAKRCTAARRVRSSAVGPCVVSASEAPSSSSTRTSSFLALAEGHQGRREKGDRGGTPVDDPLEAPGRDRPDAPVASNADCRFVPGSDARAHDATDAARSTRDASPQCRAAARTAPAFVRPVAARRRRAGLGERLPQCRLRLERCHAPEPDYRGRHAREHRIRVCLGSGSLPHAERRGHPTEHGAARRQLPEHAGCPLHPCTLLGPGNPLGGAQEAATDRDQRAALLRRHARRELGLGGGRQLVRGDLDRRPVSAPHELRVAANDGQAPVSRQQAPDVPAGIQQPFRYERLGAFRVCEASDREARSR